MIINDITIVGSGLNGLSMAAILCANDIKFNIITNDDFNENFTTDDIRTVALNDASINFYEHIGIANEIKKNANPIDTIIIEDFGVNEVLNPFNVNFDGKKISGTSTGYVIENKVLIEILTKFIFKKLSLINIFKNNKIEKISHENNNEILINNNIKTKILIACDGKFSTVRKIENFEIIEKNYNQSAIVFTVKHNNKHNNIAVEKFMPTGPFAILPMTNNRSGIIWSQNSNDVKNYINLPHDELKKHILMRFSQWIMDFEICGPVKSFPLTMLYSKKIVKNNVFLVGDSAHSIHPVAGQGLNLGIRDIATLAEEIINSLKFEKTINIEKLSNNYQKRRSFDVKTLSLICDFIVKIFSNNNKLLKVARMVGMNIVNNSQLIKKIFVYHAMGKLNYKTPIFLKRK